MNTLSKAFALIVAMLLLYIYPLADSAEKRDDLTRLFTFQALTRFVDSVRDKGVITPNMFNDFQKELSVSSQEFEVSMEHRHKQYIPVYNDSGHFQDRYSVVDEAFYQTQIMEVLFPDSILSPDDSERTYRLGAGDFFTVTLKSLGQSSSAVWRDALNGTNSPAGELYLPYGGMVRNEDS
ncbi:hypothetical protein [Paenibacillus lutrae]|uniref:Uncharacterized protein n=1 Tax=Paenibacillus lutrae TaxID=2078573 RepID=A0A7X3JYR0_9BACL|nr:hypothetical protein [Paenibacillus lutrae]MVO99286.1 hypothetical protein [Paenibacillus lutrae]